jgi:hypothetical protein
LRWFFLNHNGYFCMQSIKEHYIILDHIQKLGSKGTNKLL